MKFTITQFTVPVAIVAVMTFGAFVATSSSAHAADSMVTTQTTTTQDATVSAILAQIVEVLTNLKNQQDVDGDGSPSADTPAADLRVSLNALLKEHVNLGLQALFNVIDESDATTASVEALDDNTVELAGAIGSVYGEDAEDQFRQIWRDHIGFFADYAVAVRDSDENGQEEALDDLADYQQEIATFFNSALPEIDRDTVIAGAGEHKDLLIEAMDEYEDGDYEAAYEAQREADKQISGIANLLANSIVEQNPELF